MFGQEQRGVRRAHSPDPYEGNNNHNNHFNRGPPHQFRGGHGGGGGPYHGHGHGGHGQPFNKRHRGDNFIPMHMSLEDKITRLGETGSRNIDIGILAKEIDSDLMNKTPDDARRIDALVSKICRCIVSFPTKVGTYSTLIGLISVKHYNISCQIINALHGSYPVFLEAQRWQEAVTIIHLLSSLVNCKVIRPSALLSQFEFLLESTIEDTGAPQTRSDYFVYTVLSSLPYVAQELAQEETNEAFEKILATIETYLSKRSKDHMNVIRVWMSSDSTLQMDYLDSLWVQMKNFRANNWVEVFLHRPYNDKENKDTMASSLIPTNSPTFQIPSHNAKCFYPAPRIVFRLFEDDVAEGHRAVPGSDKIERFCIENHIRNIIDEMSSDPRDCARHLAHMYRSDQLPMKHILVETILGELFTLPRPKHNDEILYHTLLYVFGRIFPASSIPEEMKFNYDVVVNKAVKILYDNLETMNISCITRFVDWFGFHLNCTSYVYPWQNWADSTFKDVNSAKVVFVRDVLHKCLRFSFRKKIECLVQENLGDLMPPESVVQYKPIFEDNPKASELAETIKKMFTFKADGKQICETLNIVVDGVELPEDFVLKDEKHAEKLLKIDIFTSVLLVIASKSLTHLSSAIGKYRNVFKALLRIQSGQLQMIQTVHSCLEQHPQLQVILIDKLLKAELIEAKEVCAWIFSDSMKSKHLNSYTWEILNNTIARLIQVVDKLKLEKSDLKEDSQEAADKAAAVKARQEAAASASGAQSGGGRTTPIPDEADVDEAAAPSGEAVAAPADVAGDVEMKKEHIEEDETKEKDAALDEKIQIARLALDEFLLAVFKYFAQTLEDHIKKCEVSSVSFMDDYYKWVSGRMQEIFYRHSSLTREMYDKIRVIVDGVPSIGSSIINLNQ